MHNNNQNLSYARANNKPLFIVLLLTAIILAIIYLATMRRTHAASEEINPSQNKEHTSDNWILNQDAFFSEQWAYLPRQNNMDEHINLQFPPKVNDNYLEDYKAYQHLTKNSAPHDNLKESAVAPAVAPAVASAPALNNASHSKMTGEDKFKDEIIKKRQQDLLNALNASPSINLQATKSNLTQGQGQGQEQRAINPYLNAAPNNIQHSTNHNLSAYQELERHDFTLNSKLEIRNSPFILNQGSIIECTLLTGINSDLPGQITAQVNNDIYDSVNGNYILIPRGAKIIGQYASSPKLGQERLMVGFNRILFPNGRALNLGAMPASSLDGYSGLDAEVDNHFFRLLGNSILLGGISAGISLSVDEKRDENGNLTLNGALTQSLGQSIGRVLTQVIENNMNISPTLKVAPGFALNVVITKDIYFPSQYTN